MHRYKEVKITIVTIVAIVTGIVTIVAIVMPTTLTVSMTREVAPVLETIGRKTRQGMAVTATATATPTISSHLQKIQVLPLFNLNYY